MARPRIAASSKMNWLLRFVGIHCSWRRSAGNRQLPQGAFHKSFEILRIVEGLNDQTAVANPLKKNLLPLAVLQIEQGIWW
jgi:hypothetical protein